MGVIGWWFDSATPSDRRRALELWSDGRLFAYCRAEPGDVWPNPIRLGIVGSSVLDVARAQKIADFAGLERYLPRERPVTGGRCV